MAYALPIVDPVAPALEHYRHCLLCEHRCGVDRAGGERGECKAGPTPHLFRHRIELGEEAELIPSHLFYLSGCDLRCAFCIAEANAFDPNRGRALDGQTFSAAVAWGQSRGAKNIQWVGGEPTIHLPALIALMADCPALPPVVWKSDFYGTPEALALLDGWVTTFVADFKFGNDACAQRVAGVPRYVEVVTRNLLATADRLIVRHLLLPGHFECCFRPIVAWLAEHLPRAKFSLRDGFLPKWQARRYAELARTLSPAEASRARELAIGAGLNLIE
ncbi:MAG TPA: radical SAM protein [Pirellulales bacterium]|jgi:putative pyruvate formate lyase activating enzyme|nr:radical SAM protein [Pirellulales bacterium]